MRIRVNRPDSQILIHFATQLIFELVDESWIQTAIHQDYYRFFCDPASCHNYQDGEEVGAKWVSEVVVCPLFAVPTREVYNAS